MYFIKIDLTFESTSRPFRLLGTDARSLDADAPDNPNGKLNKVVDNVMYEYDKAKADGKIGCQLIFSDIGTPKANWSEEVLDRNFDVYNYVKTKLVEDNDESGDMDYEAGKGEEAGVKTKDE